MTKFVKRIDICKVAALEKLAAKSFSVEVNKVSIEGLLIRTDRFILAYRNACPHWNVELNWLPDRFLNEDGSYIVCSIHGALFRKEDGHCVFGPCVRQKLEPISIVVEEGTVYCLIDFEE